MNDFAVKEVTISKIPDENVTLVGVQKRGADVSEGARESFDLRFVFGIDDLFVSSVSFDVEAYKNGALVGTKTATATSAYNTIQADRETLYAYECVEGEYFVAFKIVGIEEIGADHTYSFLVSPKVLGANGAETQQNVVYRVTCDGLGGNITVDIEEIIPVA